MMGSSEGCGVALGVGVEGRLVAEGDPGTVVGETPGWVDVAAAVGVAAWSSPPHAKSSGGANSNSPIMMGTNRPPGRDSRAPAMDVRMGFWLTFTALNGTFRPFHHHAPPPVRLGEGAHTPRPAAPP